MNATNKEFTGSNFEEGVIIASRYELCERLGAGGMGMVFRALDRDLEGEVVALKLLLPHHALDENVFRRFRNEVLVARSLTHPNVVRTHDIGRAEKGYSYISMEFVDGFSLKDKISELSENSERKVFEFEEALKILYQIVNGVCYAHGKGIIHRDLKPANVLLNKRGEVKLADFGTARIVGIDTSITQTGQVIGTPDYMSPEQIRGENLDTSCDIYSLGILAYELVTGKRPFHADSAVALAYKHINEPIKPFANSENRIPKWFEELVLKATAKAKEDRPQTAVEIASVILQHCPEIANQTLYLGIDQTKFQIPVMNFGVLDSGSRKLEEKSSTTISDQEFHLGKDNKPVRSDDDWNLGEISDTQKNNSYNIDLKTTNTKIIVSFLIVILFALPLILVNFNKQIQKLVLSKASFLSFVIINNEQEEVPEIANLSIIDEQKEREKLQNELGNFLEEENKSKEDVVLEKKETTPTIPQTTILEVTTTLPVVVTTIPKPQPLSAANFNGEIKITNGNQLLADTIEKNILPVAKWQASLDFNGDKRSLDKQSLESAFMVNIFSKENSSIVTRLKPDTIDLLDEKNINVSGKLTSLAKQKLEESSYRIDLVFQGEVVSSVDFQLKGQPQAAVKEEPVKEKNNMDVIVNSYKNEQVLNTEKSVNSNQLPVAKGHEQATNFIPSTTTAENTSPNIVAEEIKEVPVVPIFENSFQGILMIPGNTGTNSDERKELTLSLKFQGEQISGNAKISGYDDFLVSGKVLARGMEMELKNGTYWIRLTSGPKDKKMRGLYTFPAIQKKGNWEVVMVK